MSLWGSKTSASAGWPGPTPSIWIWVSALAGDDVGVGDHQAGRRRPSPLPSTPSPQAVPNTRTTLWRAARTPGLARMRALGRRDVGGGTVDRRERIEARQRVEDRARRGQDLVQGAQDRRVLDVGAQRPRRRRVQGDGADDPGDPQADARGQRGAEEPVHGPQSRDPQRRAHAGAQPLQAAGEHATGQQRAEQAEQRRVGRAIPLAEQQRGQAGAEERAHREPGQRQRADDEPLHVAVEGQEHGEADDDPVQRTHRRASGASTRETVREAHAREGSAHFTHHDPRSGCKS